MNMGSPCCSVIIPTRDCLDFLPAALNSVDAQRCDLEIIVVDDASRDGTSDWLRAHRPDVRLLEGEGRGPARARNNAIAAAKAPLIAFLDADDLWTPGKLRRQIAAHVAHPQASFSFTDYTHVDLTGRDLGRAFNFWSFRPPSEKEYAPLALAETILLGCNLVGASTVVARRDALLCAGGFAEDLPSAEDWDLWLRLASAGDVLVSDEIGMTYLMRPGGETRKRRARIDAMERILARYKDRRDFRDALNRARGRLFAAEAEWARERGAPAAALLWRLQAFARVRERRLLRAAATDVAALVHSVVQPRAAASR